MKTFWFWLEYSILVLVLYVSLAFGVFALRHPKLTDTERLLHWREAMLFHRVDK